MDPKQLINDESQDREIDDDVDLVYPQTILKDEIITDDVPTQETLMPVPIKLVEVSTGKEIPFQIGCTPFQSVQNEFGTYHTEPDDREELGQRGDYEEERMWNEKHNYRRRKARETDYQRERRLRRVRELMRERRRNETAEQRERRLARTRNLSAMKRLSRNPWKYRNLMHTLESSGRIESPGNDEGCIQGMDDGRQRTESEVVDCRKDHGEVDKSSKSGSVGPENAGKIQQSGGPDLGSMYVKTMGDLGNSSSRRLGNSLSGRVEPEEMDERQRLQSGSTSLECGQLDLGLQHIKTEGELGNSSSGSLETGNGLSGRVEPEEMGERQGIPSGSTSSECGQLDSGSLHVKTERELGNISSGSLETGNSLSGMVEPEEMDERQRLQSGSPSLESGRPDLESPPFGKKGKFGDSISGSLGIGKRVSGRVGSENAEKWNLPRRGSSSSEMSLYVKTEGELGNSSSGSSGNSLPGRVKPENMGETHRVISGSSECGQSDAGSLQVRVAEELGLTYIPSFTFRKMVVRETEAERQVRLRKERERQAKRLASESAEEKEERLSKLRERMRVRRFNETQEERMVRLEKARKYMALKRRGKTEETSMPVPVKLLEVSTGKEIPFQEEPEDDTIEEDDAIIPAQMVQVVDEEDKAPVDHQLRLSRVKKYYVNQSSEEGRVVLSLVRRQEESWSTHWMGNGLMIADGADLEQRRRVARERKAVWRAQQDLERKQEARRKESERVALKRAEQRALETAEEKRQRLAEQAARQAMRRALLSPEQAELQRMRVAQRKAREERLMACRKEGLLVVPPRGESVSPSGEDNRGLRLEPDSMTNCNGAQQSMDCVSEGFNGAVCPSESTAKDCPEETFTTRVQRYIKEAVQKRSRAPRKDTQKKQSEDSMWKKKRENETEEQRKHRLEKIRMCQRRHLERETPEQREKRLHNMRLSQSRRLANESPEQRERRLAKGREYARRHGSRKRKAPPTQQQTD